MGKLLFINQIDSRRQPPKFISKENYLQGVEGLIRGEVPLIMIVERKSQFMKFFSDGAFKKEKRLETR